MNPGMSYATTVSFFIYFASLYIICRKYSNVLFNVSCDVYKPLIISINFITGTGFIKCIPIILSGLVVFAANFVIDIDDVLLAIIVSGLVIYVN